MSTLEQRYDSMDVVPAEYKALYEDRDGAAVLTGIIGMKTHEDFNNLNEALRKEREDHKAVKTSLSAWGDRKPAETLAQLDRITELELAAEGKIDEEKMEQILAGRINQVKGPLERDLQTATTTLSEVTTERDTLKLQLDARDRNDMLRAIGTELKILPTAVPDLEMNAANMLERDASGNWITKSDLNGITPGVDVKQFVKEMQKLRPHWWPASEGGGAGGGAGGAGNGADNPWSSKGWNMTAQMKYVKEHGMDQANRMAKAAGTTVGGGRPAK